ncbi:hypothetical protein ACET3Z_002974 [Daucus carota]
MAALSFGHSFNTQNISTHIKLDHIKKTPRTTVPCCCQSRVPLSSKTKKQDKEENGNKGLKVIARLGKVGRGLKESLSPKRKGDWKDLEIGASNSWRKLSRNILKSWDKNQSEENKE